MYMNNKYFLIQGNASGSKIHIILPWQLEEEKKAFDVKSIDNKNLSNMHSYDGWCKTNITGYVNYPSYYRNNISELERNMCDLCMKKAKNSKNPPSFIKNI